MSAFVLIRHAQSTWNATGRWQGQADPPLSEAGTALTLSAAARLAEDPPFELVVTSDLRRARLTGELLATGGAPNGAAPGSGRPAPRVMVDPGLREFHVGDWSGLTRFQIEQRWPSQLALFDSGALSAAPGGESRADFDARIRAAAHRVAQLIGRHRSARTLIVAHGGVIRSLLRNAGMQERHIPNLAGYGGVAGPNGLSLQFPLDLLGPAGSNQVSGPVTL